MTKTEALKNPMTRKETVNLKVFIHCEACKKQVTKALKRLDGVESIVIDAELGKVTVTGTVASGTLVKKLAKAGKHAELWGNVQQHAGGKAMHQISSYQREMNEEARNFKAMGQLGGKYNGGESILLDASMMMNDKNIKSGVESSYMMNLEGGEEMLNRKKGSKKSVTFMNNGGDQSNSNTVAMATALNWKKNVARMPMETSYSVEMESAEYASHMFSDENAHNCSVM